MNLPVQACTDDELEDYASIHPEAAEELARRTIKCRDMHIKARVILTNEKGEPLIDKKTKAPKIGGGSRSVTSQTGMRNEHGVGTVHSRIHGSARLINLHR